MNSRVIDVEKCDVCPYNRTGMCFHPEVRAENGGEPKNLEPYAMFPEFCPLEDCEDYAESNFNPDRED